MAIKHTHSLLAALVVDEINSLGLSNPRVLEIGAKPGWFADKLAHRSRYLGLEPSTDGIAQCREYVPHAEFVQSYFHDWDSNGRFFDVVLLVDRLSSMPDHDGVFAKISGLLAPGGCVIVATENPVAWKGMTWPPPPGPGEIRDRASKKKLHRLLSAHGFRREKSYTWYADGRTDGIFRLINGRQAKRLMHKVLPESWTTRLQESVGLGLFRVILGRRLFECCLFVDTWVNVLV